MIIMSWLRARDRRKVVLSCYWRLIGRECFGLREHAFTRGKPNHLLLVTTQSFHFNFITTTATNTGAATYDHLINLQCI